MSHYIPLSAKEHSLVVKQRRLIFRRLYFISLIVVLPLALRPMDLPEAIQYSDKILHYGCFFCLAWLGQLGKLSNKTNLLGLLLFGALIELCQSFTSYRQASLADLLADLLGSGSYLLLSRWNWLQKVNRCITSQ